MVVLHFVTVLMRFRTPQVVVERTPAVVPLFYFSSLPYPLLLLFPQIMMSTCLRIALTMFDPASASQKENNDPFSLTKLWSWRFLSMLLGCKFVDALQAVCLRVCVCS